MVKFSEFVSGKNIDNVNEGKDTELASLNVSNDEKIYNVAMKSHNSEDLKKAMIKMKLKFPNKDKIDFNKVDWEEVFLDLNEKAVIKELEDCEEITEELFNSFLDLTKIEIVESEDMLSRIIATINDMPDIDDKRKKILVKKFTRQFSI